jgi:nucleoside-diphosphate-sugar epimerase
VTLPAADVNSVVGWAAGDLEQLRGARVFVTGGTGFIGSWIAESLLAADDQLRLGLRLALLTRRPESLPPRVAGHRAVEVIKGDVRFRSAAGAWDFVVHAAATSSAAPDAADADDVVTSTIVDGTRAVLETSASARLLFLSSGAVYGPQAGPVTEHTGFTATASVYAEAKRRAERLLLDASADATIGRLFSFVGPGLPLDRHFAAGNFIGDALAGRPLVVRGDGSAVRSYLYPADLMTWLFALLVRGATGRAYNVGSPMPITIRELAELVGRQVDQPVQVLGGVAVGDGGGLYLPNVDRAVTELGVGVRTPLPEALARTIAWHRR